MTELRDARLLRALAAAREDLHGPSELARRAVLRAAHDAVEVRVPWWRQLWDAPETGVPLRALLVSLLLAGFVTLVWRGKEMSGSQPRPAAADSPVAPTAPVVVPAPAPSPAPSPQPPPPAPLAPAVPVPPPAPMPSAIPMPPADPAPLPKLGPRGRPPLAAPERAPPRMTGPAQESQLQEPQPRAPAAEPPRPEPAPARPPSPPAPAVPPRAAWEDWSEARVESQRQGVAVPREQAFHLSELLYRVIGAPADRQPFEGPAVVRLALMNRGIASGVLELGAEQARWTVAGEPPKILRPDPRALQALRAEAERLAGR